MPRKIISERLKPKVIIFDVDGVLFNTDELMFLELQRASALLDIAIDESFYARNGYDDCIYALDIAEKQKEAIYQTVRNRYYTDDILSHVRLKPGVLNALKILSCSVSLAIGFGETKEQIERYLRHFSIADYFSFLGHGAMVKNRKSNPEYFHMIVRYYNVLPEECLHVGDTLTDQFALQAGVPVAIIPTKYSRHLTFDSRCKILSSIDDLPLFIRRH